MDSKRAKKATVIQRERLIECLFNDKSLARDKFETLQGRRVQQNKWEDLAQELNALGGTNKTQMDWRRYWRDLLFRTKTRARSLRSGGSGINGVPPKPLTPEEEKIISIISSEQIFGNEGVTEIGVTNEQNDVQTTEKIFEAEVIIHEHPPTDVDKTTIPAETLSPIIAPSTSRARIIRKVPIAKQQRQELLEISKKNMEETTKSNAEIIKLKREKNQLLREQVNATKEQVNATNEQANATKELVTAVNKLNSLAEHIAQALSNSLPKN